MINLKEYRIGLFCTIEYKYDIEKREVIDTLKLQYNIENPDVQRRKNLLKIMFGQSHNDDNIDYYRPECILRSRKQVKMKSKFTRITKIQKSPFYRGITLWNNLPNSKIAFMNALGKLNTMIL